MKRSYIKATQTVSICFAALAGGLISANGAFAQEASEGVDQSGALSEIVVTANRREEKEQDVPIAIVAISGEQAKLEGITDLRSFADMVPGLTWTNQGVQSTPFLRGVGGQTGQPGNEPSVAFYVDDVYLPSGAGSVANLPASALQGIEVEKGPQGTVFGRNATGGVVQVSTKNPTADPTAEFTLGYGDYQTSVASLYASSALVNDLSANITAYENNQDQGWGRNLYTGANVFTSWSWGGRAKFLYTPTATTTFLLTLDHDASGGAVGEGVRADAGTLSNGTGAPIFATPAPSGYYNINWNGPEPFAAVYQGGVSLKATQQSTWANLVSITAWRNLFAHYQTDDDSSPNDILNLNMHQRDNTFTQELRVLSPDDSHIKWIGGLYYFHDVAAYDPWHLFGDVFFGPGNYSDNAAQTIDNSFAGFADTTITILPDTDLTIGLRYTTDRREITSTYVDSFGGVTTPGVTSNSPQWDHWDKLTYRAVLKHNFTQDFMAYAGYNTGFKAGAFPTFIGAGSPIPPAVNPEVLDAYTLGLKSEWLDHRLRFNAEGFWYNYKDLQVYQVEAVSEILTNAAKATIKGVDLDGQFSPIRGLTFGASAEWLSGKYDEFPGGPVAIYLPAVGGNNTGGTADLSGHHTVQSPPFSLNLQTTYVVQLGRPGNVTFNATYSYIDSYFADADNGIGQLTPQYDKQPTTSLLNASAMWSPTGNFDVQLWGKNITGAKYWAYHAETAFYTAYSPQAPFTYGVNATYRFGAH